MLENPGKFSYKRDNFREMQATCKDESAWSAANYTSSSFPTAASRNALWSL